MYFTLQKLLGTALKKYSHKTLVGARWKGAPAFRIWGPTNKTCKGNEKKYLDVIMNTFEEDCYKTLM